MALSCSCLDNENTTYGTEDNRWPATSVKNRIRCPYGYKYKHFLSHLERLLTGIYKSSRHLDCAGSRWIGIDLRDAVHGIF